MNRIEKRMAELRDSSRKALVPYIMTGDPELAVTVPSMHALVRAGADLIELGIPFSDPEADGPTIQAAAERALANRVRLDDVFDQVRAFRADDATTPVILMGYVNTILRRGVATFVADARSAGVDGLIMVNLPPEEAGELLESAGSDLSVIFLCAPTTTSARLRVIADSARGFLYYVSLKGITGADHIEADSVRDSLARIRAVTKLPVVVGFGIKDGRTARVMAAHADGVVVGSLLVAAMAELAPAPATIPERLYSMLGELRRALDGD